MRRLFLLILILLAIYLAYPYWTLYRLQNALLSNNAETLKKIVDFPAVRANMQKQVQGGLLKKSQELGKKAPVRGDIGEALTRAFGPSVVGGSIDSLVTPEAVLSNPTIVEHRENQEGFGDFLKWAFFSAPTTFTIQSQNPEKADAPVITSTMNLEGFRWRITDIDLPPLKTLVPDMIAPEPDAAPRTRKTGRPGREQRLTNATPGPISQDSYECFFLFV